jgi:hypothetical protein
MITIYGWSTSQPLVIHVQAPGGSFPHRPTSLIVDYPRGRIGRGQVAVGSAVSWGQIAGDDGRPPLTAGMERMCASRRASSRGLSAGPWLVMPQMR